MRLADFSAEPRHLIGEGRSLWHVFRHPIPNDTKDALRAAWDRLPEPLRTENQFLGRQYAGCGATIGLMPRCDFACRGCYLGSDANATPALPLDEVRQQLRHIRDWLGEGGNVQLTDGEVTLRAEDELVDIARYARQIGLVPMLMTHGDSFRRRPSLLMRLMTEAGLNEMSVHIDTTQRGRRGSPYRHATDESLLFPLRDEFAALIRRVRRETGKPLEVAATITVTGDNLAAVPHLIGWIVQNADTFKMVSLHPIAQVGRTSDGLGGSADAEAVWDGIATGLGRTRSGLGSEQGWLGHPACSQFVQGVVVHHDSGTVFHTLFGDVRDRDLSNRHLDLVGGLTFRLDSRSRALARLAGIICQHPRYFAGETAPFLWRWLTRLGDGRPLSFLRDWARGRLRIDYLNIVTHHFMTRDELSTRLGRERVASCAFRVPLGESMVSMCEVNALGLRDRFYEKIRKTEAGTSSAPA